MELRRKLASYIVVDMVFEIELWLAEFSDGIWSEQELKEYLRPLVENYRADFSSEPVRQQCGSDRSIIIKLGEPIAEEPKKYESESENKNFIDVLPGGLSFDIVSAGVSG